MSLILLPPYKTKIKTPANGTQLLLHMEGINGGTVFTDTKGHAITAWNGATTSTNRAKFGTASGLFNGSDTALRSAVSYDFSPGVADFTAELWVSYITMPTAGVEAELIGFYPAQNTPWTGNNISLYVWGDGTINLMHLHNNPIIGSAAHGMGTGPWYHIALTLQGDLYRVFINGILKFSGTFAGTFDQDTSIRIGGGLINCYIDEFRFRAGQCLYTTNFTPPASPLS